MAEKTANPSHTPSIHVTDPNGAPIIFFEGVPNFGNIGGIINVTLVASRRMAQNQEVAHDVVAVAFLRCPASVALDLRNALDQALLIGATANKGKAN